MAATMEAFFMVILGGFGTLFGATIGAAVITFLKDFISAYTHRWLIFLGLIYIIIIFYTPEGLMNLKTRYRKKTKEETALPSPPKEI